MLVVGEGEGDAGSARARARRQGGGGVLETAKITPGVGALPLESVVDVVGVAGGNDHARVRRHKALGISVEHLPAPPGRPLAPEPAPTATRELHTLSRALDAAEAE